MQHEWRRCKDSNWCYGSRIAETEPVAVWPQRMAPETGRQFVWTLYIEWAAGKRGHVNNAPFCKQHHDLLVEIFSRESLQDRRESEATDAWLIKTRSRM